MSPHELLVDSINETLVDDSRPKEQAIVKRAVKEIGRGVDIDVLSQRAFRYRSPHNLANTFATRVEPVVAKARASSGSD